MAREKDCSENERCHFRTCTEINNYPRNISNPKFIRLKEEITDMINWW